MFAEHCWKGLKIRLGKWFQLRFSRTANLKNLYVKLLFTICCCCCLHTFRSQFLEPILFARRTILWMGTTGRFGFLLFCNVECAVVHRIHVRCEFALSASVASSLMNFHLPNWSVGLSSSVFRMCFHLLRHDGKWNQRCFHLVHLPPRQSCISFRLISFVGFFCSSWFFHIFHFILFFSFNFCCITFPWFFCSPVSFFYRITSSKFNFIFLSKLSLTFLAILCTFPFISDSWFVWCAHSITKISILMPLNIFHSKQTNRQKKSWPLFR